MIYIYIRNICRYCIYCQNTSLTWFPIFNVYHWKSLYKSNKSVSQAKDLQTGGPGQENLEEQAKDFSSKPHGTWVQITKHQTRGWNKHPTSPSNLHGRRFNRDWAGKEIPNLSQRRESRQQLVCLWDKDKGMYLSVTCGVSVSISVCRWLSKWHCPIFL